MTLLEFLEARLAEEERDALGARAGTHGQWEENGPPADRIDLYDKSGRLDEGRLTGFQARHIARWDPARVLADIASKRRIIAAHPISTDILEEGDEVTEGFGCRTCHNFDGFTMDNGFCDTLKLLALPYADHPDYSPEWAVSP